MGRTLVGHVDIINIVLFSPNGSLVRVWKAPRCAVWERLIAREIMGVLTKWGAAYLAESIGAYLETGDWSSTDRVEWERSEM